MTGGGETYVLATSPTGVLGATGTVVLSTVLCLNRDVANRTVTVWRSSAAFPTDADLLISGETILPGETRVEPLTGVVLTAGQTLYAQADAGSVVNLSVSWLA